MFALVILGVFLLAAFIAVLVLAQRRFYLSTRWVESVPSETIDVLSRAFFPGTSAHIGNRRITFTVHRLGNLKVPSGRLIACDPQLLDGEPFEEAVPGGEYPVEVAIVRVDGEERIAFARIKLSEADAVKWEMALVAGQDPAALEDGEVYGYGVDTAMGSFMDEEAFVEMLARSDEDDELYVQTLVDSMEDTRDCGLLNDGKASVALFSSGYGDGTYASYWGMDVNGRRATLTTDFRVVRWKP